METFVKKGNKLVRIGEGKLFKKCELSLLKEDGAGVDANRRNYYAYVWTAYSSYGESDRREDIDEEWT